MNTRLPKLLAVALALAPALARAEQKIGLVDMQRAIVEVEEGKAAKATLNKELEDKQKQLNVKKAEFEKLQADFEKQAVVMSDAAKKEKASELDRRARDLQGLFVSAQKDLSEREREAMKGIIDRMSALVRELALEKGYTVVFDRSSGVVYAPPTLDLTDELIGRYNERFPAKKATKGAAAAPKTSKK